MRNFIKPGETITLTAPSGGVVAGTGYKIGDLFVVAVNSVAATLPFEGQVTGVFELPKLEAQAWTEGALVYWDDSNDEATTVATGNLLIGVAAAVADNPSTTGEVRLNGAAGVGGTISAAELEDDAVDTAAIEDDAVTTAKIDDEAVTAAKAAVFFSAEVTGTGSAQDVAHGLGAVPSAVLVAPTELAADLAAGYDCAEGAHDATNVKLTLTNGAKVKILAWA